jgi:hypothetical protein
VTGTRGAADHVTSVLRPDGVVRIMVTGRLRMQAAVALRATGMKWLAEEPTGIVVDLSAVAAFDQAAVTVLATLARAAAWWPGIRVGVYSAGPELCGCLRRLGAGRMLAVADDERAAVAAVLATARPVVWCSLNSDTGIGQAGALVAEFFATNELTGDRGATDRVVAELVGNALRHAAGPYRMSVRLTERYLQVAVRDGGHALPGAPAPGSGLDTVQRLALSWGANATPDGKVVWASLPRPLPRATCGPAPASGNARASGNQP